MTLVKMALILILPEQSTPPLSPVTYDSPALVTSRNTYECQGRSVELDLMATSWTPGRNGVQITRYKTAGRELEADEIALWNRQLEPIKMFRSSELQ